MKRKQKKIIIDVPEVKARKQVPSHLVVTKIVPDKTKYHRNGKKIRPNQSPDEIDTLDEFFYAD